ncbi:MAG: protein O-mannosyl-transferase family [Polyangiaceae bacterium]
MRGDRMVACALFALALATYFATSSSHLAGGDSAEFVTIFAKGGVAHPSGYPLYCLLLRLCAWMPGGPILGASRVTAIVGAFSVAALYRACRAWGSSRGAAAVAAAAYGVSPLAWRLATEAEVFALNALLAALLLWAAAPRLSMPPATRVVSLAGLAGLALSNHLTIVLLGPIGLFAAFHALRASAFRARTALSSAAAFGAGLLPYLYCYEVGRAPNGRYVWGEPGTWEGLVRHVSRADFGTFSLTGSDQSPDWLSNVWVYPPVSGKLSPPPGSGVRADFLQGARTGNSCELHERLQGEVGAASVVA